MLRRSRHESAFVYPVNASGRCLWYLLNRGRVWGTMWEPVTSEERQLAAETLQRMVAETATNPITITSVDSVLLLLAWFRKRTDEKAKLLPAEAVIAELSTSLAAAA